MARKTIKLNCSEDETPTSSRNSRSGADRKMGSCGGFAEAHSPELSEHTRGRALQAMDRLTKLALLVFSADFASVFLTQNGVARRIAASNVAIPYRSYDWDQDDAPYGIHDTILIEDGRENSKLQSLPAVVANGEAAAFFFRTVIKATDHYCLALIVSAQSPRARPSPGDLRLIAEIVKRLEEEFETIAAQLTKSSSHVTILADLPAVVAEVSSASVPTMLLDANLKVKAVSQSAADLVGHSVEDLLRSSHYEAAPAALDALSYYYRRALETGISTPDMEIWIHPDGPSGPARIFTALGSPILPQGSKVNYLYETFTELTEVVGGSNALDQQISQRALWDMIDVDPSADFLFETLIPRRAIRARNGLNYVSLRAWRQPIRNFQIKALKALKAAGSPKFAERVGNEIAEEIETLVGANSFNAIVPIPCGHSKGSSCLSVSIARAAGKRLNLPVVQAFARQQARGSSHPRQNIERLPAVLKTPVYGSVLLIDDVATSGHHLAEAAQLLRRHCSTVFSIAWIGGDAARDDDPQ